VVTVTRSALAGDGRSATVLVATLMLWLASVADSAAAQRLEVTVDRNEVSIEEQILLKVKVEGAKVRPELPALPDFRMLERGYHEEMQFVNGRVSTSITFNYVLIPQKVGSFEIGAASVQIDNEKLTSRPFTVRVVPASEAKADVARRDYFLSAQVSNERPFVGEQVLFTWRFYRRVPVRDARLAVLEFGDLVSEDLGELREFDTTVNGVQYRVSELRKALFAQRAGKLAIPSSQLVIEVASERRQRVSVFDFGRGLWDQKTLHTQAIELDVRPLPPAPAGYSGLVGEFGIEAKVSKAQLDVGESSTLSVSVSGAGNVQMASAPALPELPQFKVYDDQPAGSLDRTGSRLRGSKTYRKALVPLQAGKLEIPALRLVYFDPRAEEYRTAATRSLVLDVKPAEGKEELMLTESLTPGGPKVAVRILADDLLPIRRGRDALRRVPLSGWRAWAWGGGAALPPVAFLALLFVQRRRERLALDAGLRRRQGALRRATAELKQVEAERDPKVLSQRASSCLRTYIGDKLGLVGSALTPLEAQDALRAAGADEPSARRVREVLDRCEAAQYGAADRTPDRAALVRSLDQLLRDLDPKLGAPS
jgi:hypothetical protein